MGKFLSWGYSPEKGVQPKWYGESIDYVPQHVGTSYGPLQQNLPDVVGYATIGHFQPAHVAQSPMRGVSWFGWYQGFMPYGENDTYQYFAPSAPVRYDIYEQDMMQTGQQTVYGTAPTSGVYTGIDDICVTGG